MWPKQDITLNLLNDVRQGRSDAVNALLDRHRDAVRRLIQMRLDKAVARRVDASDVVQDVLFEASRRLNDYIADPSMPFHLWLRQLARDRIIDMHRHHALAQRRSVRREQQVAGFGDDERSAADLMALLKDAELTPAAATIRREMQQRFLAALQEMPDEDQEIIVMRHFEHLGNTEVAQALGLTAPAAGMRYLRAIRRLRTALGGESDEADGE